MGLGDRNTRTDIETVPLDLLCKHSWGEVSERVERDDLGWVGPGGLRGDRDGWFCFAVVGFVSWGEGTHGDGEGAIDGIGAGVGADSIAVFDGGGEAGTDNGTPGGSGGGAPGEWVRVDAVLIRISCGWVRDGVTVQRNGCAHLRRTRPGYKSFSRSFSVVPICGGGVARAGDTEDRVALAWTGLEGPSTCLGFGSITVASWRDHS